MRRKAPSSGEGFGKADPAICGVARVGGRCRERPLVTCRVVSAPEVRAQLPAGPTGSWSSRDTQQRGTASKEDYVAKQPEYSTVVMGKGFC